jgi:hypothetical protein
MKDNKYIQSFNEHQENLNISDVRLSLPDAKLFNKFKHKEYGGLDLAYRLLELGLISLQCYKELKDGVAKYIKSNDC